MTARQVVDHLRELGILDNRTLLLALSNCTGEARLQDGQRLNDATDFAAWLREVAGELRVPERVAFITRRIDLTCPRCGHVHEGDRECGVEVPGAGICRCELQVPA